MSSMTDTATTTSARCSTCGRHRWDREGGAYRGKTCTRCPREGRRAHKAALGYAAYAPRSRGQFAHPAAARTMLPDVVLPSAQAAESELEATKKGALSSLAGFFQRKRGSK